MRKTFETFDDLARSGYLFRIGDNGGETMDRYTVLFSDGDALGMNEAGRGYSEFVGSVDPAIMQEFIETGRWSDIGPGDLSQETKDHILYRVNESLQDLLEEVETSAPTSRDGIELNDGTHNDGGKGIWKDGDNYMVAIEDNEDRGPFATAAEAVRNSLPDDYSLSGPEYHSAHFPTRNVPAPDEPSI